VFLFNSGRDLVQVCVPPDLCIDRDGDGWGLGPGCLGGDCDDQNPMRNPGMREICDGQDNDCNGIVDDSPVGINEICDTGFFGQCSQGRSTCADGLQECVPQVLPRPEACNGQDDDCDGVVDNGNPAGGAPCVTALPGLCATGVSVCDEGELLCGPVILPGQRTEACNYVDDNCDGTIDGPFVDASGRYVALAHCGACGFDCNARWPGGPGLYNVTPVCEASGATARCDYTCLAGFADADGVAENGCELALEPDTVHVSTPANGGVDIAGCGTWDTPCATIQGAIDLAAESGRVRVRVSTGLYEENLSLRPGISVLGGHSNLNWVRNPSVFGTTLRGADAAVPEAGANDRIVVRAIGITAPTELSGFVINGINAGPGGNSIGVYVRNSTEGLRVVENEIIAGAGGNGATGTAGGAGTQGAHGVAGASNQRKARNSPPTPGGAGGSTTCGGVNVSGGQGGDATQPLWVNFDTPRFSGAGRNGSGLAPGTGGSAGSHMNGTSSGCSVAGNVPISGNPGLVGQPGSDGAGGGGASGQFGNITGGLWRGAAGSAGATPQPGSGGGGGGSPGGVRESTTFDHYSTTGGGGGAGGCQGTGGQGGGAGGASLGIMLGFDAAPATADSFPVVSDNRIRRGLGGRGGDGGTGGGGGEGGRAGAGGVRVTTSTTWDFCIQNGAPGGAGGRGGHGGGGGGGAGGISYDLFLWGTNTLNPGYQALNTFDIPNGTPTGGLGGVGGNSSNTVIGIGGNGVTGASGNQRRIN
jgi:hypothetical protein